MQLQYRIGMFSVRYRNRDLIASPSHHRRRRHENSVSDNSDPFPYGIIGVWSRMYNRFEGV